MPNPCPGRGRWLPGEAFGAPTDHRGTRCETRQEGVWRACIGGNETMSMEQLSPWIPQQETPAAASAGKKRKKKRQENQRPQRTGARDTVSRTTDLYMFHNIELRLFLFCFLLLFFST